MIEILATMNEEKARAYYNTLKKQGYDVSLYQAIDGCWIVW